MVWYFIGVYITNRTLQCRLEIRNFSSRVVTYLTSERSERVKYYSPLEEKFNFVLSRGHVISSIYIHFEITGDPCDLIRSQQCDLFTNHSVPNRVIYVLNRVISVLNGTIFALYRIISV